jgi:hypothetical protein
MTNWYNTTMIAPAFLDVLEILHTRLEASPIHWAITGSLGFALQGLDIAVHDIDIQCDRSGAYAIERLFSEYVIRPVSYRVSERIRSYLGALEIDHIQVEIIGDIQKRLDDQTWEAPVDVERYKRWIMADERRFPVMSLEYEAQAYLLLGRIEKAERLLKFLQGGAA